MSHTEKEKHVVICKPKSKLAQHGMTLLTLQGNTTNPRSHGRCAPVCRCTRFTHVRMHLANWASQAPQGPSHAWRERSATCLQPAPSTLLAYIRHAQLRQLTPCKPDNTCSGTLIGTRLRDDWTCQHVSDAATASTAKASSRPHRLQFQRAGACVCVHESGWSSVWREGTAQTQRKRTERRALRVAFPRKRWKNKGRPPTPTKEQ